MKQEDEDKIVKESHTMWQQTIRKRNEAYEKQGDWWPFIQSIEDVMERCQHLEQHIDDLSNKIGETQGMIKNLRKVLIKLEIVDDRFVH